MHRLVWNNKNENAYVENTELVHSVRCWNELEKRALMRSMSAKKILRSKSPKEAVRPKKNEKNASEYCGQGSTVNPRPVRFGGKEMDRVRVSHGCWVQDLGLRYLGFHCAESATKSQDACL